MNDGATSDGAMNDGAKSEEAAQQAAAGGGLSLCGVVRRFRQGGAVLEVLRGVDLEIRPGEIVALVGPSGSGKSTLLHIAGLLERPDEGTVAIAGCDAGDLEDAGRTALRLAHLGFEADFLYMANTGIIQRRTSSLPPLGNTASVANRYSSAW